MVDDTEYQKGIALEIINQLGGQATLKSMLGAHNFVFGQEESRVFMSFKLKASPIINYIKIVLNHLDYYDVEVGKINSLNYQIVKSINNVDCEQLVSVLEGVTGCCFKLR